LISYRHCFFRYFRPGMGGHYWYKQIEQPCCSRNQLSVWYG
jgi:hypothetical protein